MQQKPLLSVALLLASLSGTMAQSTSVIPLNQFIGAATAAAAAINSANAKQTTASSSSSTSSASPTQSAATSSSPPAAAHHSGINHTTLIVAIICAIVGALLIALLLGLCCWCLARRRRRRRNQTHVPIDDEVKTWRSNEPKNPGRDYSPHRNSRVTSMEAQPMIPPVAKAPDMQQHPALRNNNAENPFVPVPPTPRRQAPNSRAGLTDGSVPGAAPYVIPEAHKVRSRSSSGQRTGSNPALPTSNTRSRPSTPFGLQGIGQPYEDMHVHVLQTDSPSRELRQSLINREPTVSSPTEPIHRYDTPPTAPSRSPNRHSTASVTNNVHTATNSTAGETSSTEGSTSADDWRYTKGSSTFSNIPSWERRQHRYSNSPSSSPGNAYNMTAPPIPWEERQAKYDSPSHSPRQSRDFRQSGTGMGNGTSGYVEGARRNSRSPATSINGQPRRLRFSDLQAEDMGAGNYRHSQGVGEAL